jgi:hypothetical protein
MVKLPQGKVSGKMAVVQDIPSTPDEDNPAIEMDMESYLLPNDLNVDRLEITSVDNHIENAIMPRK